MNDDFLKKHRVRPNPHFVESLYQSIENPAPRRLTMFTNKLFAQPKTRTAVLSLFSLLIIAVLTFAISPSARAAVESLLSFNGVEVTVDEETGGLRAEGNSEAIVFQDDNMVFVESEDGSMAVGVTHGEREPQLIQVEEVAATYPNFELPTNLPAGYTLEPNADILFGRIVSVRWHNEVGDTITYWSGTTPARSLPAISAEEAAPIAEEAAPANTSSAEASQMASHIEPFQIMSGSDGADVAILRRWHNGMLIQIIATDTTLSEETLATIIP